MVAVSKNFHVLCDAAYRRRQHERQGKPWGDPLGKPFEEMNPQVLNEEERALQDRLQLAKKVIHLFPRRAR